MFFEDAKVLAFLICFGEGLLEKISLILFCISCFESFDFMVSNIEVVL
jgi:hypothetical protein|tara:strand:- start:7673 stop:7816 length:144 start_codon:yes stop_codon:yes gene_type:complete